MDRTEIFTKLKSLYTDLVNSIIADKGDFEPVRENYRQVNDAFLKKERGLVVKIDPPERIAGEVNSLFDQVTQRQ